MRLFLSSYGLSNQPEKLMELLGQNKKVLLVTNAADYHGEEGIIERVAKDKEMFKKLGMDIERLDLRKYFNNNSGLEEKVKEAGLIWVRGGNAFVLRRAMKQSGFDKIILNMLSKDLIVYGGYSAGACMVAPDLHGVDLCDDPNVIPEGYQTEIIWDGLDLFPYVIAPHYKSNHHETELIDRVIEYLEHKGIPYKALKDGQAIRVIDNKMEMIT